VFGVLDVLLFADALYRERGISLRMLADRNHFRFPLWRDFVMADGGVLRTPANCAALMRRGEHLLVFPGGAREVFKHKGEAYRLIWKERTASCSSRSSTAARSRRTRRSGPRRP